MPIEIPDDWPNRTWVEDTPLGHLETMAEEATEPVRWEVASWGSTREIASSSLPGQVRHKTGLSVGTGRALVKRQPADFPWKQYDVYNLSGSDAQVLLAPEGLTEIPTGQFRVAEVSGNLTTMGVQVELDEKQIEGRDKTANVQGWTYADIEAFPADRPLLVDPSWWIVELAKQIGYGVGQTPYEDGYRPWLDVPLQGSIAPAYPRNLGYYTNNADRLSWTRLDGRVAASNEGIASNASVLLRYTTDQQLVRSITVTMDLREEMSFTWDGLDSTAEIEFHVRAADGSNSISIGVSIIPRAWTGGTVSTGFTPFTYSRDPENPYRVQVQMEVLSTGANWTSARLRVRRGAGAPAWSAWVTNAPITAGDGTAGGTADSYRTYINVDPIISSGPRPALSRVQVIDNSDTTNTWTPDMLLAYSRPEGKRLDVEPLLGDISSPWLSSELTTWQAMQEVVEAWQGALITDVYGNLRVLNRYSLAGVGSGAEIPIDIGLRFEDLPWQMNYTDQADRLTLVYRPVRVVSGSPSSTSFPVVWEASDTITAPPGVSEVFVQPDFTYLMYSGWPWYRKDFANAFYNEWDGYTNPDGSGTRANQDSDIHIRLEQVTTSTWRIRITNFTPSTTFYMVDNTGSPWLKIRSYYHLDQTQQAVVERGATSDQALNPITIDVGNYVQNDADANALADFLWGRVNHRAWKATTIRTVPDYRLDLGDVVELTHARTGVKTNALVTKVDLEGEPGQVTQAIDLILIPPTWDDFDEVWGPGYHTSPPGSWAEFDALWDTYTWDDFDRAPTATTAPQIEEAM